MIDGGTWAFEGVGCGAGGRGGWSRWGGQGMGGGRGGEVGRLVADGVGGVGRLVADGGRGDWRSGSAVSRTEGSWGRNAEAHFGDWVSDGWMGWFFVFFGVGIDVGWG